MLNMFEKFDKKLDNTTIMEINSKIDYNITDLKERKKVIDNIMNNTDFFTEYFDKYYNYHPANYEGLATNDIVCTTLDKMASYLLGEDLKKKNKR